MNYSALSQFGTGGVSSTIKRMFSGMSNHGFTSGNALRVDEDGIFQLASAEPSESECIGVVESSSETSFTVVFQGYIRIAGWNLLPGRYYLSDTPGELTNSPTPAPEFVTKPILVANSNETAIVQPLLGYANDLYGGNAVVDLNDVQPIGLIVPFYGEEDEIPEGWLLCDGEEFDPDLFPELAAHLNDTKTPNIQGRTVFGAEEDEEVGQTGGANSIQITTNHLPPHTHGITIYEDQGNSSSGSFTPSGSTGQQIQEDFPLTSGNWHTLFVPGAGDYPFEFSTFQTKHEGGNEPISLIPSNFKCHWIIRASSNAIAVIDLRLRSLKDVSSSQPNHGDILMYNKQDNVYENVHFSAKENFCRNGSLAIWQRGNVFDSGISQSTFPVSNINGQPVPVEYQDKTRFYLADNFQHHGNPTACRFRFRKGYSEIQTEYGTTESNTIRVFKISDANTTTGNWKNILRFGVEGHDLKRLYQSKDITFSFYCKNNIPNDNGFRLSIFFASGVKNFSSPRITYVTNFEVPSSSLGWQRINVTVRLPDLESTISGQQVKNIIPFDERLGLQVGIALAAGTERRTSSTESWNGSLVNNTRIASDTIDNFPSSSGEHSIDFAMFQLEQGTFATKFQSNDLHKELGWCQRYFEKSYPVGNLLEPGNQLRTVPWRVNLNGNPVFESNPSNGQFADPGSIISMDPVVNPTINDNIRFVVPKRVSRPLSNQSNTGPLVSIFATRNAGVGGSNIINIAHNKIRHITPGFPTIPVSSVRCSESGISSITLSPGTDIRTPTNIFEYQFYADAELFHDFPEVII